MPSKALYHRLFGKRTDGFASDGLAGVTLQSPEDDFN